MTTVSPRSRITTRRDPPRATSLPTRTSTFGAPRTIYRTDVQTARSPRDIRIHFHFFGLRLASVHENNPFSAAAKPHHEALSCSRRSFLGRRLYHGPSYQPGCSRHVPPHYGFECRRVSWFTTLGARISPRRRTMPTLVVGCAFPLAASLSTVSCFHLTARLPRANRSLTEASWLI